MAAVNTSGFQVQAQPGMNYLPASQLVPNLSGIVPAASQGAAFVSQLAQIQNEAKLAPIRQALQQIQLQDAQNQLANAPLNRQLQMAQIARANQPIERVLGTDLKRIPRIDSPADTPAQDENGNYTFAPGDNNYDLTPVQRIEVTDPTTGIVSIQERKLTPIATAETLDDRATKLELERIKQESLAGQRDSNRSLAEARLNSPSWKRIGYGINPNTGKQGYLIMNEKTKEIQEIPSDLIPVPTGTDALTGAINKLTGGSSSASNNVTTPITVPGLGAAPASPAVAPEDTVATDPETAGLIDNLTKAFSVPSAPTYKSANDVKAAFKAGALPRAQAEKILREQFGLK